jgi:ribonucleotide monophosphatase NagD (HAD superfamily)
LADIVGTQTAGMNTTRVSGGREWPLADASPDFIVETVADLARLMA